MPTVRYTLAPRGLYLNNDPLTAPEGSLLCARNLASAAEGGYVRSMAPIIPHVTNQTRCRAFTKFNGRWITFGEVTSTVRFERQTTVGSDAGWTLLDHTALATPSVTLNASLTSPALFITAPPTPEKDEYLFMLDPGNLATNNGLLKLSDAGVLTHWGILAPSAASVAAITAAGVAAVTGTSGESYIHTTRTTDPLEDVADWTLATADESALSATTAISNSSNPAVQGNSIKFIVGKGDSAQISRAFGSDINLNSFGTDASGPEDFVQLWVRVRRPKHIHSLEIAFDTTTAGDFKTSFYSREVTFKLVKGKQKKKLKGLGDLVSAKKKKVRDFLADQSKSSDLTYSAELGNQQIPVAQNTWSRITLPKNSFDESGTPSWATVRAIRITVHANKQGKTAVFLDRLTINGGIGMIGDYEYTITYSSEDGTATSAGSRSDPAIDDDAGTATGIPNSIVSVKVANIERQGVLLTLPELTFDAQTKRLEIWRTVGNGKEFFRCGYIDVSSAAGHLGAGATFTDTSADYYGLSASAVKVTSGNNTAFAVLDSTEELPIDNTSPNHPDFAFQAVANEIHAGRMWWGRNVKSLGTQGLLYYSPVGRMEAVQGYIQVTSGITDPIQALVVWSSRLFVFTKAALYEILGTDEPFVAQKVEGVPGTLQPYTVAGSTMGIFWWAEDGIYVFNGQFAQNISDKALMPLYRHRLSVGELVITSTYEANNRAVAARNAYYIGSGALNFTMIYDFEPGTWRYADGVAVPTTNAGGMYYDYSTGKLYIDATTSGTDIQEFDARTYPTATYTCTYMTIEPLPFYVAPNGNQSILRKIVFDTVKGSNGSSSSFTPTLLIDTTSTALATFNPAGNDYHTISVYNLNKAGYVFGLHLVGSSIRDCKIASIEMEFYTPGDTDDEA